MAESTWGHEDQDAHGELVEAVSTDQEWQRVQRHLVLSTLSHFKLATGSWQRTFERWLHQGTHGKVQIYWEPYDSRKVPTNVELIVVQSAAVRYGVLALAPGYLSSSVLPSIPQELGRLCALIAILSEYVALVQCQLKRLPEMYPAIARTPLTPRERDALSGLIRGETEIETAQRLGVQRTTIHTHRQRLYQRLDVHSPHEAVLRAFSLRLIEWSDVY